MVLLLLAGVLDADRVHDLEFEFNRLVDRPGVVLDMREVTGADSAFLGLLNRFEASRAKSRSDKITLVIDANSSLDSLLYLDDLHRKFAVVWDLSNASMNSAELWAAAG